ncbi:MAG TPA: DedA family protein/thiosulfate sulfurtransferase GlpE [Candidatus Binatia bacterium]|nr:DedA family protein/thiosulfate sulfurtransferase GlpE [Candidatus Binatia bacterium]
MNEALEFLVRHGPAVIFAAVFIEQIGLPIPAAPVLLAAGALVVPGQMNLLLAIGAAVVGSLGADSIWFYQGRRNGNRVLRLLCRISLEPDSCVRRTRDLFTRFGMRGVVIAKFLPGLSTLVAPMAGNSGVKIPRFFFFAGVGALLYAGGVILLGVLLRNQLEQVIAALASLGNGALALLGILAAVFIGLKFYKRQRLLRELRMARITVDELHQKLQAGENPLILDLRASAELDQDPSIIRGALHVAVSDIEAGEQEIPLDREIVLYCSCPNEAGAAKIALLLQRKGIARVRPLLGGIDAWRARNYPLDVRTSATSSSAAALGTIEPKVTFQN